QTGSIRAPRIWPIRLSTAPGSELARSATRCVSIFARTRTRCLLPFARTLDTKYEEPNVWESMCVSRGQTLMCMTFCNCMFEWQNGKDLYLTCSITYRTSFDGCGVKKAGERSCLLVIVGRFSEEQWSCVPEVAAGMFGERVTGTTILLSDTYYSGGPSSGRSRRHALSMISAAIQRGRPPDLRGSSRDLAAQ